MAPGAHRQQTPAEILQDAEFREYLRNKLLHLYCTPDRNNGSSTTARRKLDKPPTNLWNLYEHVHTGSGLNTKQSSRMFEEWKLCMAQEYILEKSSNSNPGCIAQGQVWTESDSETAVAVPILVEAESSLIRHNAAGNSTQDPQGVSVPRPSSHLASAPAAQQEQPPRQPTLPLLGQADPPAVESPASRGSSQSNLECSYLPDAKEVRPEATETAKSSTGSPQRAQSMPGAQLCAVRSSSSINCQPCGLGSINQPRSGILVVGPHMNRPADNLVPQEGGQAFGKHAEPTACLRNAVVAPMEEYAVSRHHADIVRPTAHTRLAGHQARNMTTSQTIAVAGNGLGRHEASTAATIPIGRADARSTDTVGRTAGVPLPETLWAPGRPALSQHSTALHDAGVNSSCSSSQTNQGGRAHDESTMTGTINLVQMRHSYGRSWETVLLRPVNNAQDNKQGIGIANSRPLREPSGSDDINKIKLILRLLCGECEQRTCHRKCWHTCQLWHVTIPDSRNAAASGST